MNRIDASSATFQLNNNSAEPPQLPYYDANWQHITLIHIVPTPPLRYIS